MFKYIYLWLGLCLASLTMTAQVNLEISVIDLKDGSAVEGQLVTLANEALAYRSEERTNAQGKVIFRALPIAGSYIARIEETDTYFVGKTEEISLRANQKATATIALVPKTSLEVELEQVLIGGSRGSSRINAANAEVTSSLSRREVEILPTEGRDITRVLFRLPNVTQATGFYPEAPNVAINGANSLYTNYMIDGMDNNERFLGGQKFRIPIGFTQDVTVLTNNYSAEFGNSANGAINITSRSGSNETTGEVFFTTRPGAVIDASSPYAQRDLSGNQVQDGFQRYQTGFAIGGALVRSKTFYYINAEQIIDLKDNLLNVPQLGINETVRGTNRFTLLSGKIDHNWSSNFRSTLRVNTGLVNIDRQGGGLTGGTAFPSSGNSQDRNSVLASLQNTYTGNRFVSQTNLQYSRFRWNYGRADNPNSSQVSILDPFDQNIGVLGHPGYVFDSRENTFQVQQKFTFFLGNHSLKTGAELISADHNLFGGGNPNGNYTVRLNEAQVNQLANSGIGSALTPEDLLTLGSIEVLNYNIELRPNEFGARQNIFSVYVEDQWSASSRLNLTLGLRYDYDNLSRGGASQGDLNNLGPRFSFNYKLNDRSVIRGGYGLFYDKILYAIHSDALQQNTTDADYKLQIQALIDAGQLPADTDIEAVTFDGNLGASADNVKYLNGPSFEELQDQRAGVFAGGRRILNPNGYANPYTHQFTLGYQFQVDENVLFYIDGMYNESFNLFRLRNLNVAAAYTSDPTQFDPANPTVRTVVEADASRVVPIVNGAGIINNEVVNGVARNVFITESGGRSRYLALSLNLQKDRGDDHYAYRFNYTLSRLMNDTEDINFRAQDANDFESEWGPSINDRTHVLNGYVIYYPVKNLGISVATLIQSGQPINRTPDPVAYVTGQDSLRNASGQALFDANGNAQFVDVFASTTDLNGDGSTFGENYTGNSDRFPGESRNNDRLPWATTFDLGVQYEIPFASGNRLRIRADVFNLFNAANLSGYSNNATQSNQIQAGSLASGRLIRRNASAPRQFQFSANYYF